jgi:hypothetical protein
MPIRLISSHAIDSAFGGRSSVRQRTPKPAARNPDAAPIRGDRCFAERHGAASVQ